THAVIYPTRGVRFHQGLLVLSKLLKVVAYFAAFEFLRYIQTVSFLLLLKLSAALILLPLQRPFSTGPALTKLQWFQVCRFSLARVILDALWIEGLYLCGPFRSVLLFENSELLVLAAVSTVMYGASSTSKARGALFFILGVVSVAFFDNDAVDGDSLHPEGVHKSLLIHKLYEMFANFGLSDHKVGVVILFLAVCLDAGCAALSKNLVTSVGGAKRLHALAAPVSFGILIPIFLLSHLWGTGLSPYQTPIERNERSAILSANLQAGPLIFLLMKLSFVAVTIVMDFYFTSLVSVRLGAQATTFLAKLCVTITALVLSLVWGPDSYVSLSSISPFPGESSQTPGLSVHGLSGGVIFAMVSILYASNLLTNVKPGYGPDGASSGHFIGYSMAGLPLFTAGQTPSHGVALLSHPETMGLWYHVRTTIRGIMSEHSSRRIFAFLCLNLAFTFVELLYGVWTNSLGLISDGFHMLFDSAALVVGLYAAVVSRWEPTRLFSFGFHSAEVLSGFVNALFLLVISGSVFVNALARIHHPPHIHTDRLMVVSVAGLLVNLVGMVALGHAHSHGGSPCGAHGHTHGGAGHGHSHGGHQKHSHNVGEDPHYGHAHGQKRQSGGHAHSHSHDSSGGNANLRGVYLHVLADTLGSVGVIFSSYLVSTYGWNIADPICSVFIACAIGYSALPLLSDTLNLLTLRAPNTEHTSNPESMVKKVLAVEGVLAVYNPFIWSLTRDTTCISLCVKVETEVTEQLILARIKELITMHYQNVGHITIQVEKEAIQHHLQALGLKPTILLTFSRSGDTMHGSNHHHLIDLLPNGVGRRLSPDSAALMPIKLL
ncbi:Zinc transporter 5, partial [Clonorchis sinensis]